jgi:anaerobic ribonucleoside-triphosphate reductase activating protein
MVWCIIVKMVKDGNYTETLRIGGIERESIVDGPGFRYAVFVQGCDFRCPGCHNPRLQPFEGGQEISIQEVLCDIKKNSLLDGITLSGGDPFTQAAPCACLAEQVRSLGLSVVTFTGYLWEDLIASGREDWLHLIKYTNILIDGPFVMALRNLDLRFRGSTNQRLIDVQRSLAAEKPVEVRL